MTTEQRNAALASVARNHVIRYDSAHQRVGRFCAICSKIQGVHFRDTVWKSVRAKVVTWLAHEPITSRHGASGFHLRANISVINVVVSAVQLEARRQFVTSSLRTNLKCRQSLLLRWLGSRVVSVLDSGAEGPGFKSQSFRCRVTGLGKLFTPIVPLFTKQRNR